MTIETKPQQPSTYDIHCNVCGTKFKNENSESRTCGPVCELVLTNAHAKAKKQIDKLTIEELDQYDILLIQVEGRVDTKGAMDMVMGKKKRGVKPIDPNKPITPNPEIKP